jgi:SAM-dependent methyltransferase
MSCFEHFVQSTTPVGHWIMRSRGQREISILQPFLPGRDCAILEVGAGMGEMAELLRQAGYRNYTAVEPSNAMREHLARKGITAKDYMIPPLAEKDCSYDAIVLIDVFEHLNDARETQSFIAEAWRVLQPDGILCIASPDYLHWKEDFFNCDYSHNNVTSVRRTLQLLHNNGFRVPKYVYLSGFFTGILASVASYLVRWGLFFANGNGLDKKLYKLKLTFLRRFLIIGVKQPRIRRPC